MAYGKWQRLDDAQAPDGPGLVQLRFEQGAAGLVAYPTGKSAMAYYGADDESVARALDRVRARLGSEERARLWVRFAPADARCAPSQSLHAALAQFVARFGAAPALNAGGE